MNEMHVNPQPASAAAPQGVGLLVKTLHILDLFQEESGAWTQPELARQTGLARSTLSRLVRFLVARGYLMEANGRYTLGFAAVELGRRAQAQFSLVDLAGPDIEKLALATSETVLLTAFDPARRSVVCLSQIPSSQGGLRVFETIGAAYPLHSGASSKAVLAFLPAAHIDAALKGVTAHINPAVKWSEQRLRAELIEITKQGYALSREETYPGVSGIAAPILAPRGHPVGSIAVAMPIQRLQPERAARFAKLVLKAGQALSKRLRPEEAAGEEL